MAIFNSYVKLPEGTLFMDFMNKALEGRSVEIGLGFCAPQAESDTWNM